MNYPAAEAHRPPLYLQMMLHSLWGVTPRVHLKMNGAYGIVFEFIRILGSDCK